MVYSTRAPMFMHPRGNHFGMELICLVVAAIEIVRLLSRARMQWRLHQQPLLFMMFFSLRQESYIHSFEDEWFTLFTHYFITCNQFNDVSHSCIVSKIVAPFICNVNTFVVEHGDHLHQYMSLFGCKGKSQTLQGLVTFA